MKPVIHSIMRLRLLYCVLLIWCSTLIPGCAEEDSNSPPSPPSPPSTPAERMQPASAPAEATFEYWPKTVDEAAAYVLGRLSGEDRAALREYKEEDLINTHFGLARWIRDNLGLNSGNIELRIDAKERHKDDISLMVVRAAWKKLQPYRTTNLTGKMPGYRPPEEDRRGKRTSRQTGHLPKTVPEAVRYIMEGLDEQEKARLRGLEEQDLVRRTYYGPGMWVREELGLWIGNDALLQAICDGDPDEASDVLIRAVWKDLRKQTPTSRAETKPG